MNWRAILTQSLKTFLYSPDYWSAILAPALVLSSPLVLPSVDVIEPQRLRFSRYRVFISLILYARNTSSGGEKKHNQVTAAVLLNLYPSVPDFNSPPSLFSFHTKNKSSRTWTGILISSNWLPAGLYCLCVDVIFFIHDKHEYWSDFWRPKMGQPLRMAKGYTVAFGRAHFILQLQYGLVYILRPALRTS